MKLVDGDPRNLKITTPDDLAMAEHLMNASPAMPALRIGNGYDLHRLVDGRPLILGGVTIPFEKGLQGHSDADVVCHAITDAILGAAGAGDIGRHFPDTDAAWKDANSIGCSRPPADRPRPPDVAIVNIDVVVIAQRPKIGPHVDAMRAQHRARAGHRARTGEREGQDQRGRRLDGRRRLDRRARGGAASTLSRGVDFVRGQTRSSSHV